MREGRKTKKTSFLADVLAHYARSFSSLARTACHEQLKKTEFASYLKLNVQSDSAWHTRLVQEFWTTAFAQAIDF